MARDLAGNFYVTDFWGKGIRKFDRNGLNPSFIATNGRPSAVAVLPDSRLVVAMSAPQPYVAFYSQQTNLEISPFNEVPATFPALYMPTGITVDSAGYIYVLDAGNSTLDATDTHFGRVRVYNPAGICVNVFGERSIAWETATDANPVKFKQPAGIAYERIGDGTTGQIVVADTGNGRLLFFKQYNIGTNTCDFVLSRRVGIALGQGAVPAAGQLATLGNPVDVAFEYNGAGTALYRMYVAERGRNEIVVINGETAGGTYGFELRRISGPPATYGTAVTNADMKLPLAVLFEKTATGGILYVDNAPTTKDANVLALSIDSGSIPLPGAAALTIDAVPATVSVGSYTSLSGTVNPLSQVDCSVNGGTYVTMSNATNWNDLSPQLPLSIAAGSNYILCKTTYSGKTTFAEARTNGGALPAAPSVLISQPGDGVLTKNATVTVSGTSDTAGATVKIVNALAGFTDYAQTDATASHNWSKVVTLAEGSNVINVTVTKGESTSLVTRTVTVTADYTVPVIAISFLAASSTTGKPVQNIDGVVTDANLGSATLDNNAITVNGVAVPASAKVALSPTKTYFSVPVTLARGQNTVTVQATDLLGFSSAPVTRSAVTFAPDVTGLTVTNPATDNAYLSAAGTVAASGTVDPSFTTVTAGNRAATLVVNNWSTPDMTIYDGFAQYLFTATDGFTTFSEKRTIIAGAAGTPYAQLATTTPATDIVTKSSSVPIAGSVAASSPLPTISIDGNAGTLTYDSGTGNFTATVNLSSQGTHVVKVTADSATAAIRNIIYDTTPPAISIQANANETPSKIVGSIEPSAKITAIDAKLNGNSYSIPLSVLSYDAYVPGSGSVVWHADLTAPQYAYDKDSLIFTAVDPALNQKQITYAKGVPVGDINKDGKVDLDDALLCLRKIVGTYTPPESDWFQADVGLLVDGHAAQDGIVNISDAVLILNKAAGVVTF
jgi:hypothetical protein